MTKLWHISDTHFSRDENKNLELVDKFKVLRQAMSKNDLLLITGDVVDDGHPAQFEQAEEVLKPFKKRLVLVPGNHDYGATGIGYSESSWLRFLEMTRNLECAINIYNKSFVSEGTNTRIICLQTCKKTGHPFDFSQGEIGDAPLAWLTKELADAAEKGELVLVAMHHHPFYHSIGLRLEDYREFLKVTWARANSVFFGHSHDLGFWQAERVPIETMYHSAVNFRHCDFVKEGVFTVDLNTGKYETWRQK